MKAWLLDRMEGIQNLRMGDVADPKPGPGEAVLALEHAALNPADSYLAQGQYPARPPLPHILGRDGVGRVVAVGEGVAGVKIGDRRIMLRGDAGVTRAGTFAEKVAVPADSLVEVPPGWSSAEASCAALVYLTAYQALTQWGRLPPSIVLITGASGGVGTASMHLCQALGHSVVALSGHPEKHERLQQLGAQLCVNPNDVAWQRQAKEALPDRRVDLIIDSIGGKLLPETIELLGYDGKVSLVGRLAGPVPNFNTATLFFRRIRMGGVAVAAYTAAESREAWKAVLELMGKIQARPLVDSVYPFEQLPAAFQRVAEGPFGKVVLKIGDGENRKHEGRIG
jgi:NADPH2:quinone reductase